jgi:hypothetical protein
MKTGDRVMTPNGPGEVVELEEIYKKNRYGVKMDDKTLATSHYKDGVKFYWEFELHKTH